MSESSPTISFTPPIADEIASGTAQDAAERLAGLPPTEAAALLGKATVIRRNEIFELLPEEKLAAIQEAAEPELAAYWKSVRKYPDNTLGRLMEPPAAVFSPEKTLAETTEALRELTKKAFITYGFTVDPAGKLLGVVVMRELLLGRPDQKLSEIALPKPFSLSAEMEVTEAMKTVLNRHYPVYPVCDHAGKLIGLVRGSTLFEAQAVELSAQAGSMVGVDKEERMATPWVRSLLFRHPWLQLNLLTAFVAAAVVGLFENTLEKIVLLAVFLPVMSGQSGNTGCQALAVFLRALTLGEIKRGREKHALAKEALLGLCNGALVGLTAGIGMFFYARMQHNPAALGLAFIVFFAMIGSCIISGVSGVIVPLALRRLGADPATASSIFLTTATDVVSMGLFLGLATLFLV